MVCRTPGSIPPNDGSQRAAEIARRGRHRNTTIAAVGRKFVCWKPAIGRPVGGLVTTAIIRMLVVAIGDRGCCAVLPMWAFAVMETAR